MTAPHYFASTQRIALGTVFKYLAYPLIYAATVATVGDHQKATLYTRLALTVGGAAVTTAFLGLEADLIDQSAREAVSAELGIDAREIQFSDYKHSKNSIAHKAHSDLISLQKYRYANDALFMMPMVIEKLCGVDKAMSTREVRIAMDPRSGDDYKPWNYNWGQRFAKSTNGLDMLVYGATGAYWLGETFFVNKTGYYEIVKLRENLEATGKDMSSNDLMAIYQRARTDQNLPMIPLTANEEYKALTPLLQRMANAYNQHDGKFGVPELIYLIGLNKINIHAKDGMTVSQAAVESSKQEIDRVLRLGLAGIREENRGRMQPVTTSYDILENSLVGAATSFVGAVGKGLSFMNITKKRPEEYISRRDPSEAIGFNSINR